MLFEIDVKSFAIFLLVFSPLELLFAERREQRLFRDGWLTDFLHFFITAILSRAGLFVVIWLALQLGTLLPDIMRQTVGTLPLVVQVIVLTVLADLGFYLGHLAMHKLPALWQFHAVHHSSENLDWLASYRVHPVDHCIVKGASLLPIFSLGFSDSAIVIGALIYQWQSLWLHSNVKMNLGPLKWLVATPEFHHWHHANDKAAIDKNLAGQISLWDVVFGTAYMPGPLPEKYGVNDAVPRDYLSQLAYPFVALWRRAASRSQAPAPPIADESSAAFRP